MDISSSGLHSEDLENLIESNSNRATIQFDEVIGHIEDIIIGPTFKNIRDAFMDQNYYHFEDSEENKLIYTDIFQSYIQLVEAHLESELTRRIPELNFASFFNEIGHHKNELDGEVFELLRSFADFLSFKQMMIDYKCAKLSDELSGAIVVVGSAMNRNQ
ncbi:ADP-ribosylation factor-like protein 2-binding protein [Cloeon dipterum]|uniref:ADP-ribosylation factor-like protein 2-binding protein n=1 Tax=Cloeon dipterum TaxID=197152 RepID=UPI00321F6DD2